jgi:hypothetical protein
MTMEAPEETAPETEHQQHRYAGYAIPWFVHLLWVSFWIFALVYVIKFLLPVIRGELLSPP